MLKSPIKGRQIKLKDIDDKVFSNGLLGKGYAVIPSIGEVTAPFSGKVKKLYAQNHAISIISEFGLELLIHVGLDTVNLEGYLFEAFVETGDSFMEGDVLIKFNIEKIVEQGYDIISPVVAKNNDKLTITVIDSEILMNNQDYVLFVEERVNI